MAGRLCSSYPLDCGVHRDVDVCPVAARQEVLVGGEAVVVPAVYLGAQHHVRGLGEAVRGHLVDPVLPGRIFVYRRRRRDLNINSGSQASTAQY